MLGRPSVHRPEVRPLTDRRFEDIFAFLKTLKPVDHDVDNARPATKCERCDLSHGGGQRNKPKA